MKGVKGESGMYKALGMRRTRVVPVRMELGLYARVLDGSKLNGMSVSRYIEEVIREWMGKGERNKK